MILLRHLRHVAVAERIVPTAWLDAHAARLAALRQVSRGLTEDIRTHDKSALVTCVTITRELERLYREVDGLRRAAGGAAREVSA